MKTGNQFYTSAPLRFHVLKLLYTIVLCILLPLILLASKKKLSHAGAALANRSFWERFGWMRHVPKSGGIHVHCVSVGELNAASGVIARLLKEYPKLAITLTTSSTTGAVHAYNLFKDKVNHTYLPVDIPWCMKSFYKKIKPTLVLVTEVEVWPNMLHQCTKQKIPVVLINGRMTSKSLRSYKRFSSLFRHTFRQFSYICSQSSESFENFLAFGVYKHRVKLSRNLKFDLLPVLADEELGKRIQSSYNLAGRPVLLVASSHEPEEKILLNAYTNLKKNHPDLALIVVPRHPQRFDEVNQIMCASGFRLARVSQAIDEQTQGFNDAYKETEIDCLLVDTMGWLKACYSISTIAFVGGSFANKGGHNALESALYSTPIVMGPSIYNNPSICQYLASQNALMIASSEKELQDYIEHWLSRPEDAAKDGERGLRVLLENAGSVEYTLSILRPILIKA